MSSLAAYLAKTIPCNSNTVIRTNPYTHEIELVYDGKNNYIDFTAEMKNEIRKRRNGTRNTNDNTNNTDNIDNNTDNDYDDMAYSDNSDSEDEITFHEHANYNWVELLECNTNYNTITNEYVKISYKELCECDKPINDISRMVMWCSDWFNNQVATDPACYRDCIGENGFNVYSKWFESLDKQHNIEY